MTIAEKLQTIAENEQKVYNAGKKAEYDRFWDIYQKDHYFGVGLRDHYNNAFSNYAWNDDTYNPKYSFVPISYAYNMFTASMITDTKQPIDFSKLLAQAIGIFSSCRKLKTIKPLTVAENTTYKDWFQYCVELENLSIKGVIGQSDFNVSWSKKLSKDSIRNIVNCLSADTSGLTVTISQTAVNTAFETSTGANDGATSQAWLDLSGAKSNWTISLLDS